MQPAPVPSAAQAQKPTVTRTPSSAAAPTAEEQRVQAAPVPAAAQAQKPAVASRPSRAETSPAPAARAQLPTTQPPKAQPVVTEGRARTLPCP